MVYVRLESDTLIDMSAPTTIEQIATIWLKNCEEGAPVPFSTGGNPDDFVARQKAILFDCSEKAVATVAFHILSNVEVETPLVIQPRSWTDLNLFDGLASQINKTHTVMGKAFFLSRLMRPIGNLSTLKQRQTLLRYLMENSHSFAEPLRDLLFKSEENEKHLLSFWDGKVQLPGSVNSQYIRYFPKTLNKSSVLVELSAGTQNIEKIAVAAAQCASAVLMPLYSLSLTGALHTPPFLTEYTKRFLGLSGPVFPLTLLIPNIFTQGITALAAGVFSGLTLKSRLKWTWAELTMDAFVHNKVVAAAQHYRTIKTIYTLLCSHPEFSEHLEHFGKLKAFFEDPELKRLFSLLESRTFNGESFFFFRHGNVLIAWDLLQSKPIQKKLSAALTAMGELDTLLATAHLLQRDYRLADYVENSPTPVLTPLANLAESSILAQSLGITPQAMRITPFLKITTSPDDACEENTGGFFLNLWKDPLAGTNDRQREELTQKMTRIAALPHTITLTS